MAMPVGRFMCFAHCVDPGFDPGEFRRRVGMPIASGGSGSGGGGDPDFVPPVMRAP